MKSPDADDAAGEADLPTLRKSLVALGRQVEDAQARVIATIEAKHAEFVTAATQIGDLRSNVGKLQSDVLQMAFVLRDEPGQQEPINAQAPRVALRSAMEEHKRLRSELAALDSAATVLMAILSAQQQLSEVDNLLGADRFENAADLVLKVSATLKHVSGPAPASEPAMLRAAKTQYYQRRAMLTSRLDERLAHLVSFGTCLVTGCQPHSMRRVWLALQILDLRSHRVDHLAEQTLRSVLKPLLDAAKKLPPGRSLRANVVDTGQDSRTWSWVEEAAGDMRAAASKPAVDAIIPVLQSFFTFALERLAAGAADVHAMLGRKLYPVVAAALLQHFDIGVGANTVDALEQFELDMAAKGLISSKENTLARHAQEQRQKIGERRRATVLEEARSWLLQEDVDLVPVSDAEEPGSVTQMLSQQGGRTSSAPTPTTVPAQAVGSATSARLRQALQEDDSLLRLPEMRVSSAAHKTTKRMRELLDDAASAAEQRRTDASRDLGKLAREVVTLFSVLRPFAQKVQLRTSPRSCGVFLADTLYLAHVLMLLPFVYCKRFPKELQHVTMFVDLVPQLRRLGESHFLAMLKHQQEQLRTSLRPFDLEAGVSRDRVYVAVDAAIGGAMQQAKLAVQSLAVALPAQLLREVTGTLLGVICKDLLGKLFALQSVEPDEVSSISALLNSALGLSRQILLVAGIEEAQADDVPGWAALQVTADLLGSDFSRFLEKRAGLMKALTREEAVRLMHLSWREEALSPEDAWDVLGNASRPGDF